MLSAASLGPQCILVSLKGDIDERLFEDDFIEGHFATIYWKKRLVMH